MTQGSAAVGTDGEPKTTKAGGGAAGAWEAVGPIVAALITGVGLLAFVAFFGGAILWDRADQAGLPGTEAVALMPRSTLLATGGHFLVWAFLLSAIAVGALWLANLLLRDHQQIETEATLEAAALAQKERASEGSRDPADFESGETRPVGKAKRALVEAIRKEKEADVRLDNAHRAAHEAQGLDEATRTNRLQEVDLAMKEKSRRDDTSRHAQDALIREIVKRDERRSLGWRSFGLALALVLGEVFILIQVHPGLNGSDHLWLLLAIGLTSFLAAAVFHTTRRFLWFAVAAFLAVAVFQGVATHYDITSEPMVEPAAVLMGRLPTITGVFVAETDDRIYLGVSKDGVVGQSAALVALPRDRVTGLAVGKLTRVSESEDGAMTFPATDLADELWEILCSHVPTNPTVKERPAGTRCPTR